MIYSNKLLFWIPRLLMLNKNFVLGGFFVRKYQQIHFYSRRCWKPGTFHFNFNFRNNLSKKDSLESICLSNCTFEYVCVFAQKISSSLKKEIMWLTATGIRKNHWKLSQNSAKQINHGLSEKKYGLIFFWAVGSNKKAAGRWPIINIV